MSGSSLPSCLSVEAGTSCCCLLILIVVPQFNPEKHVEEALKVIKTLV